jgi:hypothetical protein
MESASAFLFRISLLLLVAINGAAIATFFLTRRRDLVDRWTPRLVAVDAFLIGTGFGVPLVTGLVKLGLRALSGAASGMAAIFR